MSAEKIECPKCAYKFAPTEETSKKIRAEMEAQLEARKEELEADFASKTKAQLKSVKDKAYAEAKADSDAQLADVKEALRLKDEKLAETQKNEIELRKAQRVLEQEKNEFALKLTRQLDAERSKIVEETSARVSDEYAQKELEWGKTRADMLKQMDELRRKADQGSQQTQGEVVELQIESLLKETFSHDSIEEVAKGVKGADLVQVVQTRTGVRCGSIIWEIKQTRSWSDGWPEKLKGDKREAKADIAVIVTAALPKGVERIGLVDGVWVCDHKSLLGLALALRSSIVEVAQARQAQLGRKEKAEEVYDYVVGTEFRGRIQALVETMVSMQEDLNAEKRAFDKIWQKREKSILRIIGTTAGLYGDFSGTVGNSLPEIKQLSLEQLI